MLLTVWMYCSRLPCPLGDGKGGGLACGHRGFLGWVVVRRVRCKQAGRLKGA